MTMSIRNVNNDFNLARIERPQALSRAERIQANEGEIAKLESEILLRENNINITEKLLSSNHESLNILNELKSSSDELLSGHKKQLGFMIDARNTAAKVVDLDNKLIEGNNKLIEGNNKLIEGNNKLIEGNNKSIALKKEAISVIEKMIAIMEKNPAKYGQLSNTEFQKQPEVLEAKAQVVQLANSKVSQYPKGERAILADTAKNVVDATFFEIKATDIKANLTLFNNLEKRIEAALDRKHETLALRDQGIRRIMNAHYKSIEQFSRIKKLDYLDLAFKNIEV